VFAEEGRSTPEVATPGSEEYEVEEPREVGRSSGRVAVKVAKEVGFVERIG
jgi:hypothetical protein